MNDSGNFHNGSGSGGSADDVLRERLSNYFDDVTPPDVPASLQHTTLADLAATHSSGGIGHWFSATSGGQQFGFGLAGVAATLVLIVGIFTLVNRGGSEDLNLGNAPGTTTTHVVPTSKKPTATDGNGNVGAGPGTTFAPVPTTGATTPDPNNTTTTLIPIAIVPGQPTTTGGPFTPPTTPNVTTPPATPATTPATTAPTTVPSVVLFSDDFSTDPVGAAPPTGWTVDSGSWSVGSRPVGHDARNPNGSGTESRLSVGSSSWSNYTITGVVTPGSMGGAGGFAVRYQDANNYSFCKIDTSVNQLRMGRVQGGVETILNYKAATFTAYTDYTMVLSVSGSYLGCGVAGVTSMSATDATWSSGRIALVANGYAVFRAIVVKSP